MEMKQHRVKEHTRSGKGVRDYIRGKGSSVKRFAGTYGGKAKDRTGKVSMNFFDKAKARIAAAKQEQSAKDEKKRQEQERLELDRLKIRNETQMKVADERYDARLVKIRHDEEVRAREGGFFKRGARTAFSLGLRQLQGPPRKSSWPRRKTKKAPKTRSRKRQGSRTIHIHVDR